MTRHQDQGGEHPSQERIARYIGGGLAVEDARVIEDHLQECPDCDNVRQEMTGLVQELRLEPSPRPDLVKAIMRRVERPARAASGNMRMLRIGLALTAPVAAAATVVLLLRPATLPGAPDSREHSVRFAARGEEEVPKSVHMRLYAVERASARVRQVRDGDSVPAGYSAFSVALEHLPGQARFLAVYARSARGTITWLRPVWTEAAARPACIAVPDRPGELEATEAVDLDLKDSERIAVTVLVSSEPCHIAELDQRLESGWEPEAGTSGLLEVQRLTLILDRVP